MHKAIIINIGDKFGKWTVLSSVCRTSGSSNDRFHKCRCNCGSIKEITRSAIASAGRRNGGCTDCYERFTKGSRAKDGMKKCCKCSITKSVDEFNKNIRAGDGLVEYCRSCRKDRSLRESHGISLSEYTVMLELQGGTCAICDRHSSEFKKGLAVDHNHETGAIRQLLCPNCNTSLGLMQDDAKLLIAAAEYLRKHSRCLSRNQDQAKNTMRGSNDVCQIPR